MIILCNSVGPRVMKPPISPDCDVNQQATAATDNITMVAQTAPTGIDPSLLEPSRLKRTFTLPRNPFGAAARISKRKLNATNPSAADVADSDINSSHNNNNNINNSNKKIFRRPSLRKFINRIAQHIGGVPSLGGGGVGIDSRVPTVGLQTWTADQTPGVTGIRNHGNTCFINAVLQCISHTDILAEYFVLDKYKIDLSRRNKLNAKKFGTKGEVTEQLAVLLKALWACQYQPELSTTFKQIVERYGVQYKGTQQHDALEFLIWLLDKVHEDLNMAPKKKYKSIKTSGRPDEVIAAETLENYKRRDNSFIHSVFQAQYRSSLSCPRCHTQSNTFDPFQCISVQLPQLHRYSVYVTVLYTSQQPRQVKIALSLPSGATVSELRDLLESDTSIPRAHMLLTEIAERGGFLRTFADTQTVNVITEIDPVYCIEVPQLTKDGTSGEKDDGEDCSGAYVLLCWINVLVPDDTGGGGGQQSGGEAQKFGSPYTMQVSRETSYEDLQKLVLKEMAPILHEDVLTSYQKSGIFRMRISDPAVDDNEPGTYLLPQVPHPLFTEAVDQALALCGEDTGPAHLKLVLEWDRIAKTALVADDREEVEEHASVKQLRAQALQGGAPLTLEECLRHYTKAETLDDAWRCPQCQQYQPVIKTLDMWSLPDILVVHFKRFRQQTVRGRNSTKLTTMVDFPVYSFDMTPHVAKPSTNTSPPSITPPSNSLHNLPTTDSNAAAVGNATNASSVVGSCWSPWKQQPQQQAQWQQHEFQQRKTSTGTENLYDLYGVCYHHGTDLETGHYTAACKNPYDQQWYLYDDAKVTNISQNSADISVDLVNNSAYILFYQKRCGVYVNSSGSGSSSGSSSGSNSNSSAASTSSVGSSTDTNHWVAKMPKFFPPKNSACTVAKGGGGTNTLNRGTTPNRQLSSNTNITRNNEEITKSITIEATKATEEDIVTLRNSQNTLNSGMKLLKAEDKYPSCEVGTSIAGAVEKKKQFTPSVYINADGNVDIRTTETEDEVVIEQRLQRRLRPTVVSEGDVKVRMDGAVGMMGNKFSSISWMSPQPERKLNQSQTSM